MVHNEEDSSVWKIYISVRIILSKARSLHQEKLEGTEHVEEKAMSYLPSPAYSAIPFLNKAHRVNCTYTVYTARAKYLFFLSIKT